MTRRRRQTASPTLAIYLVLGAVALIAAVSWWAIGRGGPEGSDTAPPITATGPTGTSESAPEVPPLDLPELDASDAFIRDVVAALSARPELARWLVTDDLVRRFVGAVVDVAGGRSPRSHVDFLIPEERLTVRETGERVAMDPISYERYALLVETLMALDTGGTARLFHQLHPLFDEAYAELGIPGGSFDEAFELAMDNVLSATVPSAPPDLVPVEGEYEFVDPTIENMTSVEKHLVRVGPANAAAIQSKLEAIYDEIRRLRG